LPNIPALKPTNDRGILARLTLKGNFIWALDDPTVFLDGDAFGVGQAGTSNTSLDLPSGNRRRGGDFEMWFWLIAQPPLLAALQLTPSQIFFGATSTATVTLSGIAPAGGVVVSLTTSNPAVGTVPASLTIAAGNTSAPFVIQGNALGQTTITATLPGAPSRT